MTEHSPTTVTHTQKKLNTGQRNMRATYTQRVPMNQPIVMVTDEVGVVCDESPW